MPRGDRSAPATFPDLFCMRIALVHEWLASIYGSEQVFLALAELFPQADLFAVVDALKPADRARLGRPVNTTWLQGWPLARSRFRAFLPWMPRAIEALDLSGYDLVISSSHCVAKGVVVGPDTLHISYIHSPMRYAWDAGPRYLAGVPWLMRPLVRGQLDRLRDWDALSAARPHALIANSRFIARRIRACWGREVAAVIPPPVDCERFPIGSGGTNFVTASRFVPYKRLDVLVEAFRHLPNQYLICIGEGPELARCRSLAGPNVTLPGFVPGGDLAKHLGSARAFLFAAEEDFGIAPVEAMACGTPVIAYGRGGILDSVIDGTTGRFFDRQDPLVVAAAIERFLSDDAGFDRAAIAAHAAAFARHRFQQRMAEFIGARWDAFAAALGRPAPSLPQPVLRG